MFERMSDHSQTVIKVLKDHPDKKIDFFNIMNRFSLDSIGEIGFGQDLQTLPSYPTFHPFLSAFDTAQQTTNSRMGDVTWTFMRFFNMGAEAEMKKDIALLRKTAMAVVKDRRDKFQQGEKHGDFLSLFVEKSIEDNTPIDDDFLTDICLNFLIAGRDTTACSLTWLFFQLTQHPEILAKCRKEIKHVTSGAPMSYDEIHRFEYLKNVQMETLRLHPSVPRDSRIAMNDDVLPNGMKVKAGSMMGYNTYAMGRDKALWGEDALEFKPERWEKIDQSKKDFPFVFPAFHAGPRMCLGKRMALMEMTILMVNVLPVFDFELLRDPKEVTYTPSIVLQLKDGLPMKFTKAKAVARG